MAITQAYSGTEVVTTTEWSLTTDTSYDVTDLKTDVGVFEIWLDLSAITSQADLFEMVLKEKVLSGGATGIVERWAFSEESDPYTRIYLGVLMYGWDVTLIKLGGTDRSISWSIRKVA
jgi:hypothetical protein